jgi:uncharacterized protein (TIGR03083 family)
MTTVAQEPTLAALAEEFNALDSLAGELAATDWMATTPCPGWDVRAHLAHVIGTESMLAGHSAPDVAVDPHASDHVRNDFGAINERWVRSLAGLPVGELLGRFRAVTEQRLDTLRSMAPEEWDAVGFTPAGPDTYGRFMRLRVFDCWMHEQDMRDATGRPGHEAGPVVGLVLDEMTASLGYVVGKQAALPGGSAVSIELTGDAGRTVLVDVADRARVVAALERVPTVTLRMPVGVFTRLAGGRVTPAAVEAAIEIGGDQALGRRLVENLAFTI